MTDEEPLILSPTALRRYLVVSQVDARVLAGQPREAAIEEVLELGVQDEKGRWIKASKRSVYRWLEAYGQEGIAGLEPHKPLACPDSAVLSPAFLEFLRVEKHSDPQASIPELLHTARVRGVIGDGESISRITVWRACRRMGLPVRRTQTQKHRDMRAFRHAHRMMMALCDGKHFRAGVKRLKRVALSFLDNASRYGLGGIVGTAESTELFLHGKHYVIRRHGLMNSLYVDRGPGFISKDTQQVCAQLGIGLIHGEARYPEGHGGIEKSHQLQYNWFLRHLDGNPEVDPDPQALTLRLNHWIQGVYNHRPHEALNQETPAQRWAADPRPLRFPESQDWLDAQFLLSFERRVSKHNLLPYKSTSYEVPRGHAGEKITVTRHLLAGTLSILHQGKRVVLHPVDLEANAYARRARPAKLPAAPASTSHKSAAHLTFQADFAPIVDVDGGYKKGEEDE